jgi:hypothetical protein
MKIHDIIRILRVALHINNKLFSNEICYFVCDIFKNYRMNFVFEECNLPGCNAM